MVLSNGMVHFLKIKKNLKQIYQNYIVALRNKKSKLNCNPDFLELFS